MTVFLRPQGWLQGWPRPGEGSPLGGILPSAQGPGGPWRRGAGQAHRPRRAGSGWGAGREEDYTAGQGGSVSEGLACSVRQDSGLGGRHAHTGGHLDLDMA